jgi:hypothetical protein
VGGYGSCSCVAGVLPLVCIMNPTPEDKFKDVMSLENSTDPELASEFLVLHDKDAKTCEIMCTLPYHEGTDLILREYYDMMVEKFFNKKNCCVP